MLFISIPMYPQYAQSFASSRDAILLRNTLQDAEACQSFRRYLVLRSTQGMRHEQNITFWLEVQRFKVSDGAHIDPHVVLYSRLLHVETLVC